ncbi:hypothetical protein D9M68_788760 [compost metagenome]
MTGPMESTSVMVPQNCLSSSSFRARVPGCEASGTTTAPAGFISRPKLFWLDRSIWCSERRPKLNAATRKERTFPACLFAPRSQNGRKTSLACSGLTSFAFIAMTVGNLASKSFFRIRSNSLIWPSVTVPLRSPM